MVPSAVARMSLTWGLDPGRGPKKEDHEEPSACENCDLDSSVVTCISFLEATGTCALACKGVLGFFVTLSARR